MTGVIVIGGRIQGLGIMRVFSSHKIPVILLDSNKLNIAKHSVHCQGFINYPAENLLECLLDLGSTKKYSDWLLMPTGDQHVEVLSKNKAALSKYFKVGTDHWDIVEKCYNKRLTYKIARNAKIPIADFFIPNTLEELEKLNTNFPCIIKPAVMHTFYSKLKKKVFVCNNKEELVANYRKAVSVIPANEIIIQSIINGHNEQQFSACFLFDREKEIQSLVVLRARQYPPDFGNSTTFACLTENKTVHDIATRFLKEIQFQGLCEVEFKLDTTDNSYKLLEINPRTWKWHTIAVKANADLLINYYNLIYNKPLIFRQLKTQATFRHVSSDLLAIFKYKSRGIYKSYKKENLQYAVWDRKDIKPAFFEILYLPYRLLKR